MAQMWLDEIWQISILLKEWYKICKIAETIWRWKSTIYDLLNKNWIDFKSKKVQYVWWKWWFFRRVWRDKVEKEFSEIYRVIWKKEINFNPSTVHKQRQKRRSEASFRYCRIKTWSIEEKYIIHHLKRWYSPEQISWRRKFEFGCTLSKGSIYSFVYTNHKELLRKHFRRKWRKYRNHKSNFSPKVENKITIEDRPQIVKEKTRIWDWEMDTVIWLRNWVSKRVILTLVDRKSWFLVARILEDKSTDSVVKEIKKIFDRITKDKQYTITTDNWSEFADHEFITEYTWMKVYFCHPNSPWEKWLIENTNWLLREYFPKKTDFNNITKNQLQYYVSLINHRPRKRLQFLTPYEVFYNKLKFRFDFRI